MRALQVTPNLSHPALPLLRYLHASDDVAVPFTLFSMAFALEAASVIVQMVSFGSVACKCCVCCRAIMLNCPVLGTLT